MAEHSTLTGASLHEPKGAASAGLNQVYQADGAGGGGFADLPAGAIPSNVVIVNSASDLPDATASVITLAADTNYVFGPLVSIGANRLVLDANSILSGVNRKISGILSTTSDDLITATGVDCRVECLTFDAPSCSRIIKFDGAGTATLRVQDCLSATHTGIAIDSTDAVALLLDFVLLIGGTDGLVLSGTDNSNMVMETTALFGYTGTALDFGSSTWGGTSITNLTFSGEAGSVAISGLAASANIKAGARCVIARCSFNGAGTNLQGITVDDIRFFFGGNQGVADSETEGHMYLPSSGLTTTLAAGVPTKINGTTWVTSKDKRFTITSDGRMTYIGENDIEAVASLSVTGAGASGSNEYNIYIAKNGAEDVATKARQTFPSTSDTSTTAFGVISLSTNDYLEAFVEQAGGTDFNAKDANMVVRV